MTTDAGSDIPSGIGARLRAGRERSGLSLLQAAEKLHVDAYVLEALEAERFGELGATVFVRGHIRRYAELVRESPLELQALYAASAAVAPNPDLTRVPTGDIGSDPRRLLIAGIFVVVAVAVIGSAWWIINNVLGAPPAQGAARESQPTASAAVAKVARPVTNSQPQASVPAPAPAAAGAGNAAEAPLTPAAVLPVHQDADRPRTIAISLRFAADSWAEVYDAHGERLFYDVGSADSVHTLTGLAPLRVVLGNAPAVALEVNGRAIPFPSGEARDGSAQFEVSRSGRVMPSRLAATDGQRR